MEFEGNSCLINNCLINESQTMEEEFVFCKTDEVLTPGNLPLPFPSSHTSKLSRFQYLLRLLFCLKSSALQIHPKITGETELDSLNIYTSCAQLILL
uniref:Uncharacterized protein n=1 Tax=Anguilla anguilla TaxID=7936 RepID=A0A0E9WYF1_ANGAN